MYIIFAKKTMKPDKNLSIMYDDKTYFPVTLPISIPSLDSEIPSDASYIVTPITCSSPAYIVLNCFSQLHKTLTVLMKILGKVPKS